MDCTYRRAHILLCAAASAVGTHCCTAQQAERHSDTATTRSATAPSGSWHTDLGGWAFLYGTASSGPRGSAQVGSVNELGGKLTRSGRTGDLILHLGVSTDPLTTSVRGYPQLLQCGEIYHQQGIPDRGHPDHVVTEISATESHIIARGASVFGYLAPVGEPPAGPIPSRDRASAANIPFEPIGDHWQDASHIAFGVATLGLTVSHFSMEGSVFNGREPSDNYTSFQYRGRHLDSYAGRASFAFADGWRATLSWADIKNPEPVLIIHASSTGTPSRIVSVPPEALSVNIPTGEVTPSRHIAIVVGPGIKPVIPSTSLHRTVLAAYNDHDLGGARHWSSTFLVASQRHVYEHKRVPSALAETDLDLSRRWTLMGRAEWVRKNDADLNYTTPLPPRSVYYAIGAVPTLLNEYNVAETTIGIVRALTAANRRWGIGFAATLNRVPATLVTPYGSRIPVQGTLFLRWRQGLGSE